MAALCHHSGRGWRFSVATHSSPTVQQRQGKCTCTGTCKHGRNGDAMPAVLDRRGYEVQSARWLWPTDSRRREPPLTNGLRSQLRKNQPGAAVIARELWINALLDTTGLGESSAVHVSTLTPGETVCTLSTIEQWKPVSHDFQSSTIGKSKSRTNRLVETRAPASRHTLTAALSTEKPRLASTPALEHAARWWPRTSSGRPHRQVREDRGKGSHKRRRRSTRKSWGGKREKGEDGTAKKGSPANGPIANA